MSTPFAGQSDAPWVVLDFETTGLSPESARVIEVAALRYRGHRLEDAFVTLINPGGGMQVPSRIEMLTGIGTHMLRDAPSPERAFPQLMRFLGKDPVVAHNAQFDQKFVMAELLRLSRDAIRPSFACSIKGARKTHPGLQSYRLGDLASRFGLAADGALHRAKADAQLTGQLWLYLLKKAHSTGLALDTGSLHRLGSLFPDAPQAEATPPQPFRPKAPMQAPASIRAPAAITKTSKARLTAPSEPLDITPKMIAQWMRDAALLAAPENQDRSAMKDAVALLVRCATAGHAPAAMRLTDLVFKEADIGKALGSLPAWLEQGAESGFAEAALLRAELARSGRLENEGIETALHWFARAADLGSAEAAFALGALYASAEEARLRHSRAAHWFERGAALGSASAAFNLALCFANGTGVARSGARAQHWYEVAFKSGEPDAAFNLALLFEAGDLLEKNLARAEYWFKAALDAGHEQARMHHQRVERIRTNSIRAKRLSADETELRLYKSQLRPKPVVRPAKTAHHPAFRNPLPDVGVSEGATKAYLPDPKLVADVRAMRDEKLAHQMGVCYEQSEGKPSDPEKAAFWYRIAVELGSEPAKRALTRIATEAYNPPSASAISRPAP